MVPRTTEPERVPSRLAHRDGGWFWGWNLLIGLALATATVVVYAPARQFGFLAYDDRVMVADNPHVSGGLTFEDVRWAFRTGETGNWHPLTWISYMIEGESHGLDPGGVHLTNLLLHAANAWLLFLVLGRMTGARWPSALVAALFALHPLHVESVAWIAERKDVLSAFFWFASMGAYARYAERPGAIRYGALVVFFALGLMTKPMLVTLPFVLLLLDFWPLRRFGLAAPERPNASREPQDHGSKRAAEGSSAESMEGRAIIDPVAGARAQVWPLVREKLPLFGLSAASSVVTYFVQQKAGAVTSVEAFPISSRFAGALVSYALYAWKMVWPSGLAPFYPRPDAWPTGLVIAGLGVIAIVTVAALREGRRRPYVAVGWLWYLGTLVPVIGIVQVGMQSRADRYTSIPLVGLFLMVVWGAADLASPWSAGSKPGRWTDRAIVPRAALAGIAAIVLAACAVATRRQLLYWKNTETLFGRALEVTRDNAVAHNILGNDLAQSGRLDEAIAHFREGLRIEPNAATHTNLGFALAIEGRLDEAIAQYREALAQNPDSARAHAHLGEALDRGGNTAEAVLEYQEALRLEPDQPRLRGNLGACLASQGKTDEAMVQYVEALRSRPDDADLLNNLGAALQSAGRAEEAAGRYEEAIRARPDFFEARLNLASLLARLGRIEEAAAQYREVLRQRPGDPAASTGLGRVLSSAPR